MQVVLFSDVNIKVTYSAYGKYDITVADKTFSVTGALTPQDNKNILDCKIDGMPFKANVVMNGNALHIFTQVWNILLNFKWWWLCFVYKIVSYYYECYIKIYSYLGDTFDVPVSYRAVLFTGRRDCPYVDISLMHSTGNYRINA